MKGRGRIVGGVREGEVGGVKGREKWEGKVWERREKVGRGRNVIDG